MSEIMVFLTKEDLELLFSMVQAKTANTYNILYTMESIPATIKDEFIRLKKLEAQLVAYKELAEFESTKTPVEHFPPDAVTGRNTLEEESGVKDESKKKDKSHYRVIPDNEKKDVGITFTLNPIENTIDPEEEKRFSRLEEKTYKMGSSNN